MSDLIAITFDGPEQAGTALRELRELERRGLVRLTDTAVVRKDADGKIHTKNEVDSGVELGVGVVGTLGLLVGIAFPIAGVAAGLAGGAWAGSKMHLGIDGEHLRNLRTPATSLRDLPAAFQHLARETRPEGGPRFKTVVEGRARELDDPSVRASFDIDGLDPGDGPRCEEVQHRGPGQRLCSDRRGVPGRRTRELAVAGSLYHCLRHQRAEGTR